MLWAVLPAYLPATELRRRTETGTGSLVALLPYLRLYFRNYCSSPSIKELRKTSVIGRGDRMTSRLSSGKGHEQ